MRQKRFDVFQRSISILLQRRVLIRKGFGLFRTDDNWIAHTFYVFVLFPHGEYKLFEIDSLLFIFLGIFLTIDLLLRILLLKTTQRPDLLEFETHPLRFLIGLQQLLFVNHLRYFLLVKLRQQGLLVIEIVFVL